MEILNYTKEELGEIAKQLVDEFSSLKIWCFDAEMGAGKTTLIKEIGKYLGVKEEMSSPTFSIVNEYESTDFNTLYHFDFYRLNDLYEAYDIGVEDYIFSGNRCLMEWPEIIEPLLPDQYLKISINLVDDKTRSLIAITQ